MKKFFFLLFQLLLLLQPLAWASVPGYDIERAYLHDGQNQTSIDAISQAPFAPFAGDLRLGLLQGATWIRFRINHNDPSGKRAAADAGNLSHLAAEKAAGETELTAVHAAVADSRAILKHDDGLRGRHALVAEQIQAADREFVRWHRLRVLIGSADGSLFARFAQGLTLEHLTVLANRHLRQLNPRYTIRRATDGAADDLELEIVDHYQADVTRPMRSLSGGESFLVSLALALGLSQLASGRTSIESLFIDEGFGSLDAETLEVAMSALENLQAGGKVIGVISHVPAMQERITVQINVTKETGGCSRITLRS